MSHSVIWQPQLVVPNYERLPGGDEQPPLDPLLVCCAASILLLSNLIPAGQAIALFPGVQAPSDVLQRVRSRPPALAR